MTINEVKNIYKHVKMRKGFYLKIWNDLIQQNKLTMNLHIRQSLNRSNWIFTLANVNVLIVWDDISNGQKRIVTHDNSIGR